MAPEQLRGEPAEARSDLWAAGAVLYEMATGKRPFPQESAPMLTDAILRQAAVPPRAVNANLSPELERVIAKALEKDPEHRYQSAKELRVDLRRLGLPQSVSAARAPSPGRKGWARAWGMAGIAAGVLLAGVAGTWVWMRGRPALKVGPPHVESLAVLPLENLSRDPGQEYFADGMTEELIAELANVRALRVISRTSVMQYKGAKKPLPEIARELNVDAVVDGSVQRSGDRVRISAQLIYAPNDSHLWANSYERDLRDILTLQKEVAREITREVKVSLAPQEQARLAAAQPVNPQAYEAFLHARYYLERWSADDAKKAEQYFLLASQEDPNWPLPYGGLAETYTFYGGEDLPRAREAATKALELDQSLGEARYALALVRYRYEWDFAAAEKEFKRASDLSPNYGPTHHLYSHFLLDMGRFDESLTESRLFLELDPISPAPNLHLGFHYLVARQYDLSLQQNAKTVQMDPNYIEAHRQLGQAYLGKGNYEQAIAELSKARELSGDNPEYTAWLAHAYAVAGRRGEAQKLLDELASKGRQRPVSPILLSWIYAGLGQKDLAFARLEKAYQERDTLLLDLKTGLEYDNLRSDPRFSDLLRRVGLPP
jgi:TolB-like protein/Tfp pilus assembly protein PilF